jgi:hypothetical protein
MGLVRASTAAVLAIGVGAIALSGGSGTDPRTPVGLPELPAPFLGVAVVGSGGRTAAVDAYGNVVDLRGPGPAGPALLAVNPVRQRAGTVSVDEATVARVTSDDGRSLPLWRADSVRQRYVPGTNVLRTAARFGDRTTVVVRRIGGRGPVVADRRWLARARPIGTDAPAWARRLYLRSLLVLRALTDRRAGAVAAGARDGWAYVWPRDAGAVALAFASAGYRPEARRVVRFLLGLDLDAAARFHGTGEAIPGRDAQGDAIGWLAAAVRAAGLGTRIGPEKAEDGHAADAPVPDGADAWLGRADYQEGGAGDYLGNAIASGAGSLRIREAFATPGGLVRTADDPGSGLDAVAAWAVRPFPRPALFPAVRRTLLQLAAQRESRFGLLPSENWHGGEDPWTAPTAWTAWSLAALGERQTALSLMGDLRRAATPLGLLPERVDAETGLPRSTTPLAWSHAFAILAIRELWPGRAGT